MRISIIGTITQGGEWDIDGKEIVAPTTLPGYHVNADAPLPGLDGYRITPATPFRVLAGVPTYFYRFADEAEAMRLLADYLPPAE